MKLTKDEEMLALLYGDGTRSGLISALTDMKKVLQSYSVKVGDDFKSLGDSFLQKLSGVTEEEFKEAMNGE